jgi:hypothetical protein
MHCIKGRYRYPVAYYVQMTDVAHGFTGHGFAGTCYTHEQVNSIRREDLEEMEHLTVDLEDETTNDDVYPEDSNDWSPQT